MKKCTSKKGGYSNSHCDVLSSICEIHPKSNSKGLFARSMVNIESGESLGVMIILKQGKYLSRGIALNVCPFCGGSLMDQGE